MPNAQLKLYSRALPVIVVILFVLQLTWAFQGWTILLVGFGGAWLIAYLWSRSLARGLRLTREMRFGWTQVGDVLEERFTLANTAAAPALWVEVRDHSTLPGYVASRATGIGGDAENSWTVTGVCTRRGAYTLGPTTLRAGDPFGIYTVTLDLPARMNLMVMPPIVPLPKIEIASGGRAGAGRQRSDAFERTVNAAGVREYLPGDGQSQIHWRTTARRDALFVRQLDRATSADWWIVLDLDQRVQAGHGQDSTLEHGVILAASLADRGLRAKRQVGLLMCGDQGLEWMPPRDSPARRWEILRALALVSPGRTPLANLLSQLNPSLKGVSSLIIITPAAQGDWIETVLPLRWRGIVPTVLLLDPGSFGGRGDVRATLAALADLEIAHHVITRDVLDRPEMRPGRRGHWEWHVSPRGRAILKSKPRDMAWKVLT
ncbi:MAG: DUF58 domain-containing protein [Chloroflexi bacterium]|nr:DUF58 domain-containing protein [Chloroflexota bacterium]